LTEQPAGLLRHPEEVLPHPEEVLPHPEEVLPHPEEVLHLWAASRPGFPRAHPLPEWLKRADRQ
jgi:hypothetical protein